MNAIRRPPPPTSQWILPWLALSFYLGLAGAPVMALGERELEEKVQAITVQLRCPTCQGISVKDSAAAFSRQIRDKVRRMVREGQSEQAILAFFVSRYGEWILRAPKKEGLGLVLWVLPGAAMVFAGGLIGYKLLRGSREARDATQGEPAAQLTAEQRARIDRDLRRFEEQI